MAQVPDSAGPSVAPDATPPDALQRIQASPSAFGADVAQGLESLGEGTAKAGHVFSEIQTSDALNNAMSAGSDLVEKFRGLRGADALNAQAEYKSNIDGVFTNARKGLKSLDQQYAFDQQARSFRERYLAGMMSTHTDQQAHEFGLQTNNASYANGQAMITADPNSPDAFEQGVTRMHEARVKNLQLAGLGNDPEALQRETRQTAIDATEARISALIASPNVADHARAKEILTTNSSLLADSPRYDALTAKVGSVVDQTEAQHAADSYMRTMDNPAAPGTPVVGGNIKGQKAERLMDEATVLAKIDQDYKDDPKMGRLVRSVITERSSILRMEEQSRQLAQAQGKDRTARSIGDAIFKDPTQPIEPLLAAHPDLTQEQVEHMRAFREKALQERIHGAPGDYGPKYSDIQSRIFSTGPDRIINAEQLLPLAASGNINPAGFQEANRILGEVSKPGAEADRVLQGNFYAAARHAVTLEYEGGHDIIPGSGDKWNKALPALNQALAAGRAKGLSNQQMMDPDNKDSIWPTLKPFMPTANETMDAQINKDNAAVKKFADWQKIDNIDDAKSAYVSHQITRDQARQLWDRNKWGKPTQAGPQVPVQP